MVVGWLAGPDWDLITARLAGREGLGAIGQPAPLPNGVGGQLDASRLGEEPWVVGLPSLSLKGVGG